MPRVFNTYRAPVSSLGGICMNLIGTSCVFMSGPLSAGYARATISRVHAVNVLSAAITVSIKFFNASAVQIGTTRTYTVEANNFIALQEEDIDLVDGGWCLLEAVTYPVIFTVTSTNWTET